MKTIILIIVSALFLNLNDNLEEKLNNCLVNAFKNNGVDLQLELNNFEQELIKDNIIKDNTWNSYKTLFDSLSREKNPIIFIKLPMEKFTSASILVAQECSDSLIISKIPKLSAIINDLEKAVANPELGYSYIYEKIPLLIDSVDFNKNLYNKYIKLILLSNSIYSGSLKNILNTKIDDTTATSFTIFIDSLSNYYLENKYVTLEELEKNIKELKENYKINSINLSMDKSVTIDKTIPIMDICRRNDINLKFKSGE